MSSISKKVVRTIKSVKDKGSAFAKLAEHEVQVTEAKARITAIKAAHIAKNLVVTELEKARDTVHTESDAIKTRIETLLKSL